MLNVCSIVSVISSPFTRCSYSYFAVKVLAPPRAKVIAPSGLGLSVTLLPFTCCVNVYVPPASATCLSTVCRFASVASTVIVTVSPSFRFPSTANPLPINCGSALHPKPPDMKLCIAQSSLASALSKLKSSRLMTSGARRSPVPASHTHRSSSVFASQ